MHASKYAGALHPEPFWFFIPILLVGALPWFFHLPAIVIGLKDKNLFSKPLIRYCVIWALFPFIFFSASSGKLATYILPCFPPLAVLIAYGLYNALDKFKKEKLFNTTNLIVGYFLITILAAAVTYVIISSFLNIPKLWNLKQLPVGIIAIFFWAVLLFFIKRASSLLNKFMLFALAPILAMSMKSYLTPESVLTNIAHGDFINGQSKYITRDTAVMAYQDIMGAVCWYLKRDDIYIYGKPGELEYSLKQPEFQSRFISKEKAAVFINEKRNNNGGIAIFLRTKNRKDIPIASDIDATKDKTMFSKFNPKQ
jgi:4-amino-4-deoxy-L-arabinose transferase